MAKVLIGNFKGPKGEKGNTGPRGPEGPAGPAGEFDPNSEMTFEEASARENINSGESAKTIFGKIKKYFTDLKPHAFSDPVNSTTSTSTTKSMAAAVGKNLQDQVDKLEKDVESRMPKSGGTFTGGITVSNGDIKSNQHMRVSTGKKVIWDTQAALMSNSKQNFYMMGSEDANYAAHLGVHDNMWTFDPDVDGNLQLGTPNHKWGQLYAQTGTINTSDKNKKNSIAVLDDKYIDFFMKLMPVSFKFNDGTSGRTHIGFISQDIEKAMEESGLSDLDFAGFCKDQKTTRVEKVKTINVADKNGEEHEEEIVFYEDVDAPGEYVYSLRYDEFVALNTAVIQRLCYRVDALEKILKSN